VVTVSGGSAPRLKVDGAPVLLATTFAAETSGIPKAQIPIVPPTVPPPVPPPGPPPVPPVPIVVTAGQILLRVE
jgi:hypothetical protein